MSEPDLRPLYRVLNDLIDEMVELREAVSLFEKQVLDKAAPLPSASLVTKVRKPRQKKTIQTSSQTDLPLQEVQENLDDKLQVISYVDEMVQEHQKDVQ